MTCAGRRGECDMKEKIIEYINDYVRGYEAETRWGRPITGFADAHHPLIRELHKSVGPKHVMPDDVISGAKTVIAYYIPFTRELAAGNRGGTAASRQWAVAYEETNALFSDLNAGLIRLLEEEGWRAAVTPEAVKFDRTELISNWSQRHFARAAGIGTFGINNMLITKTGCCGRCSTVVTDMDTEHDRPLTEELCLYKKNGSCGVCMKVCPAEALGPNGYDRHKCYSVCRKNAEIYRDLGSSYEDDAENGTVGSEVCGKCVVNGPCAFWNK